MLYRTIKLTILFGALAATSVQADTLVKRVSCKSALAPDNEMVVARSHSTAAPRNFTIQVVRHGCRPRSGLFTVSFRDSSGITYGPPLTNQGRHTDSLTVPLVPNSSYRIDLQFNSPNGTASGTFDYSYSIN